MNESKKNIASDVVLGKQVKIYDFVNLYGCTIGDETRIGTFVEVQKGVTIGARCKIQSHTFICEGVTIDDECFIGHGVMFINDNHPRAVGDAGAPEKEEEWKGRMARTTVKRGAVIGSNATILGGVTIGEGAVIGAGAVVTRDVADKSVVAGSPAKEIKK
jgi:UDP-2-acetamido-3-amino-2,3-dideoxy-glucuronate N-acetyltransferase